VTVHNLYEYPSVIAAARREGWVRPLTAAHLTPCTEQDVHRLIAWIRVFRIEGGLPTADLRVSFRNQRGAARYHRTLKYFHVGLPRRPGTYYGYLRAGLVLHELAHVIDHLNYGKMSHHVGYRQVLRGLVERDWRTMLAVSTQREIYGRHRGPYTLLLTREMKTEKKSTLVNDHMTGPFSGEEAHEEARMLVTDPRENILDVHVFSNTEGQFIGAYYKRGTPYLTWAEMRDMAMEETDGGVDLHSDDQPLAGPAETTLLPEPPEPVRSVAPVDEHQLPADASPEDGPVRDVPPQSQAAAGTKPRRGAILVFNPATADAWPLSQGAQIVKDALLGGLRGTAHEIAEQLGPTLTAAGIQFPDALIRRLKQAGLLQIEVTE
jgi:hypothetical protein